MGKYKNLDQEKVYNSVVKIVTTSVILDLNIPYNIKNQTQSVGAGFFIDNKSHILTAAHVVENAVEIWIKIPKEGQKIFKAEIVCVYPDFDIGIVKIIETYRNQYFLPLGNSDDISLRDEVFTIGYPKNPQYPIVTSGTISGTRSDYIQTDTPVNPGNSGGPLINDKNEVVGITSAVLANSEDSSLIIPINIAKNNLDAMITSSKKIIHKNVLGAMLVNGTDNYKELYGGENDCKEGIVIKRIIANSPLEGLVNDGDVICSFNDGDNEYKLDYFGETTVPWESGKVPLDHLIKRCSPKKLVSMTIWSIKDNKTKKIKFNLKTFEELYPVKRIFPHIDKIDYEVFGGMIVMNLTLNHLILPQFSHLIYIIKNEQIFKEQLLITHVFPNSKIAEYNTISAYSLISKINGITVSNITQFRDAIKKPIKKNGKSFITIETDNKDKVILNTDELAKQEKELMSMYKYSPSRLFDSLKSLIN